MRYKPEDLGLSQLEQDHGLPAGLLSAVMKQESGGNPNAKSSAGALGLFQFMPETAKQYGIDPLDPQQAAQGAARMYSDLGKKYNGDLPSMLAAYNWGSGNLDRKGMAKLPAETRNYISSIMGSLPDQAPQQDASKNTGGNPLAKIANAVGNFLIPQAQADEMPADPIYTGAADIIGKNVNAAQISALPAQPDLGGWEEVPIQSSAKDTLGGWEEVKSPLEQLGHMAGIAGRGLASGAAILPAAVLDIAQSPRNLLDYTAQSMGGKTVNPREALMPNSAMLQELASRIGGKANNMGERLLEDASMGVGAMATGGGINSLPLLASGATGGLAAGATREAGGNQFLQALAGIAGGVTPMGIMAMAKRGGIRPNVRPAEAPVYDIKTPSGRPINPNEPIMPFKDITPEQADARLQSALPLKQAQPEPAAPVVKQKTIAKTKVPTADEMRAQSSALYKEAEASGGQFNKKLTEDFFKELKKSEVVQPDTEAGALTRGADTQTAKLLERIAPLEGKSLSLKSVQQMDTELGNLIDMHGVDKTTGRLNAEGYRLNHIQDKLQDMALNDVKYIDGSTAGVEALKKAKAAWRKQLLMGNIEKIIVRSSAMEQPAQAMRVGLRTLAMNPTRMKNYSKTEQALIKSAMKSKLTDEAMRLATSRLNGIIAAGSGHFGGGIAMHVAGIAARGAAEKLMLLRMNKILETIARGSK